jgi:NADPH:quinone reductase-like Zn-dependent oxidoreductase
MRSYELQGVGLDKLVQVEREPRRPGPGQVAVRVRAASLNYRDLLIAEGRYPSGSAPQSLVPVSDGAGEVIEVGDGVSSLRPGDRVIGNFFQRWNDGPFDRDKGSSAMGGAVDGVLAEQVIWEEPTTVKVPAALSFEEAATLPCAGLTAWVGLVERGSLAQGESILAMGTGGVSIFALQLAKARGARVLLTSSSDEKLRRAKALGADATVNYRERPHWDEDARSFTGGRGVDHILEVGGEVTLPTSLKAVRDGGHISLVGLLSGKPADPDAAANERGIRVDRVYVGSAAQLRSLVSFVEAKALHPVIDRVFAFDEARQAYEHLRSGRHFGKVIVRV